MNKLIILSLAALVACALGNPTERNYNTEEPESQLALFEPNHVEAADVKMAEFTDFCYKSRDRSQKFLQNGINGAAMKVYNAIFKTIEKISIDAIEAGNKEIEQGRQIFMDDETAMKIATELSEQEVVEPMSIDGEEPVVEAKGLKTRAWQFFASIANVFKASLQRVADETWTQLAMVRDELNTDNFKEVLLEACSKITDELVVELKDKFENDKAELRKYMTKEDSIEQLKAVSFENVNCVTTRRLVLAARLCHGVKTISPILYPFLDVFVQNRRNA